MALFNVSNGRAQFDAAGNEPGDVYGAGVRLTQAGATRVTTTAGTNFNGGIPMSSTGQVSVVDATAGLPAGTIYLNGLPISNNAVCVSRNAAAVVSNGLPFDSAGAVAGDINLDLNFVGATSLNSSITFTRASSATYFNSAGVLTTATTDVPRFDYNPSTLAAQGLLIEEARTNLLLQSADFTTTWTQTNVTITANTTASPDGGTNGDTLLINANGATTSQTSQSFTAGSTITVSVFAKKNASNFLRFEVGGLVNCWFDLNTGVTGTNSAGSGNVLFSAKSIQAISNGWYRCVLTVTTATITTLGVNIFATNTDNTTSSINSSIFLWGAQTEVGALPTSYIPTTTTALTRAADVANVNTVAPWYNATEGTLYVQAQDMSDAAHATSQPRAASLNDTTTSNTIEISRLPASAQGRAQIIVATVNQFNSLNTAWPLATQAKIALAYKANDYAACLGGGTVFTNTASSLIPTVTALSIGDVRTTVSNHWTGWIQRVAYYPRRLSNAELQAITT